MYGKLPAGYERYNKDGTVEVLEKDTWTFAYSGEEVAEMGFWAFHVDTLFFSITLGAIFLFIFARAAKNFSIEKPTKPQKNLFRYRLCDKQNSKLDIKNILNISSILCRRSLLPNEMSKNT